jgi:hypothetical protein
MDQSLTYARETSTCVPAYAPRSTLHCCQPLDEPQEACQTPVVPVGLQVLSGLSVW